MKRVKGGCETLSAETEIYLQTKSKRLKHVDTVFERT